MPVSVPLSSSSRRHWHRIAVLRLARPLAVAELELHELHVQIVELKIEAPSRSSSTKLVAQLALVEWFKLY